MADIVSSAIVQEAVSRILSGLAHKYEDKDKTSANENLERLEMAHIKLEAALQTSNKWQITDASLSYWRKKLKRASQECDETLHQYKQRIIDDEQLELEVRNSSFPRRIAHATKSLFLSTFSHNSNKSSRPAVQRFEWFADCASEFLRFVELGGTPHRRHMPFNSLIKHLFAGKELHHEIAQENNYPSFLLSLVPIRTEHGIEASLTFIHKDGNALENNFLFSVMLQLSESTDIVGIAMKCLQLYSPHFKSTVEVIQKELVQLPLQDFSWVPYADSLQKRHWDNLHSFSTQWFRPNPLCCKQHGQQKLCHSSKLHTSILPDVSLEPVVEMNLQCQVSLSNCTKHWSTLSEYENSLQGPPHLNVGFAFMPHGSPEVILPANRSSAIVAIGGEEQHCLHTDITLEQVEDIMLPNATDYFRQNAKARVYQMLWTSKHGTAYIHIDKASRRTRRHFRGARRRKVLEQQDQEWSGGLVISRFLNLWVAHMPVRLQSSIMDWMQKEKESQLAALQLHQKS